MSEPVDRAWVARNEASRARLLALLGRLTDADLAMAVGEGWSVGTNLAHLAFWDGLLLQRWQEAAASGRESPIAVGKPLFDLINDALEPTWARLDLDAVRTLVRDASGAIDAHVAALPDAAVAAVLAAGTPNLVDRSIHRASHLDPVEAVLAGA